MPSLALHPAAPTAGPPLTQPAAGLVDVFVAGVGHVGGALLRQIAALPGRPRLRVVGGSTTRGAVLRPDGVPADALAAALAVCAPPDWPALAAALADHARPLVVVDATGSSEVAARYEALLGAGVHVVTSSKLANAGPLDLFYRLQALGDGRRAHYRFETTVGAGLPLVRTVEDLAATGDRVRSVRAVLSGTMTYLFSEVEHGVPFSVAVAEAVRRGYAEPDPRDDLSGEDVVRKGLILGRAAGLATERAEVEVDGLASVAVRAAPRDEVVARLAAEDGAWARRARSAEAAGHRLRYVARLDARGGRGHLRVGVEAVPADSPLGRLGRTDNVVEITTDRYAASPLVVQGPGAGAEVTAGGVLADVLAVARAVAR
ncbi:aspartate kinase [Rubrivirga sp. IMCC43871]|uniref:aspartate kinase n=1 Tax=Rubrivirga sp. IMCC43871 TaxID=3391575 RepID=UPI00398FCCBB